MSKCREMKVGIFRGSMFPDMVFPATEISNREKQDFTCARTPTSATNKK